MLEYSKVISREDFGSWKNSEVTKSFVKHLVQAMDFAQINFLSTEGGTMEQEAMSSLRAKTKLLLLQQVQEAIEFGWPSVEDRINLDEEQEDE